MNKKNVFITLTSVLAFFQVFSVTAQDLKTVQVTWLDPVSVELNEETYVIPKIDGQDNDNLQIQFYYTEKVKSLNFSIVIDQISMEDAPQADRNFLSKVNFQVSDSLDFKYAVTDAGRSASYAVFMLKPYVKQNGQLKRVTSFSYHLINKPAQNSGLQEKDYATSSVLASGSGQWYKISVKADGIYKLDKAFLESCGISTSGLNPLHINIYGNGDGKLPLSNAASRTDDLAKNAIYIEGEGDGSFDQGDYILFYGWGPDRWSQSTTSTFDQDKNIYSEISCYYINVNPNGTPLRISEETNSSAASNFVTSYSYFDIHENELTNLLMSGQRWYGELFDTELSQTFNFNVPDIETSTPVTFTVAVATDATTAGSTQKYSINNTVLTTSYLPTVSSDYARSVKTVTYNATSSSIPFNITINRTSPSIMVYLDRILLNARRNLVFTGDQFNFRDLNSVATGVVSQFTVSSMPASGFVWDVTDRHVPRKINGTLSGSQFVFVAGTDSLREFVASDGTDFLLPSFVEQVDNQNLHALSQVDYLIVTHENFLSQANRLAALHQSEGLTTHVVTTKQVYNEFSSGMTDPGAIRMLAKMFYDRGATTSPQLQYLTLFGDGIYDNREITYSGNFIPTYQVESSENHTAALVTDDFYGLLGPNDALSGTDMLDIAVGRILAYDQITAKQQVDKIEHYMKNGSAIFSGTQTSTFGDWRMKFVQIADDEQSGSFVTNDCEPQADTVAKYHPEMNCQKLYLDAYTQVTTAGGQRYPDVNTAIDSRMESGALMFNYVGHGGEVQLADEQIMTLNQAKGYTNINNLTLFVSATCEFTRFDDPTRISAGEWFAYNSKGGAVALMTTTRPIIISVNSSLLEVLYKKIFERNSTTFKPLTIGEIMAQTKNLSTSSDNRRCFLLIGDPALRLALPVEKIVTDSINGVSPDLAMDTVKALSKMVVKGHVEDWTGNVLSGFNGEITPSVYDKPTTKQTLGQDPNSPVISFSVQDNILFKGKATVSNGYFEFSFIVPKDITFTYGQGKISYYANNGTEDAGGTDNRFLLGGIDTTGVSDDQGPDIVLYLNDESFVNGSLTSESPVLKAKLYDESGINTVGTGVGHDITAVIDAETSDPIVLNEYYASDLDTYQSGVVTYTLSSLSVGNHTLTFKAWDVNNNSSEVTINFTVQKKEALALDHVLNYPNPFTTKTTFYFEHNQVSTQLEAQVQIFTVSGKLVKTISEYVNTTGFRSQGIEWDGRDDFGDQLAKGVYIYKISVNSPDGTKAEKIEKLVLLK